MHYTLFFLLLFVTVPWSYSSSLIDSKTYTVAFAQDTLENDFRRAQVTTVQQELQKYPNIRFVVSNAKANTSLQIKQIEDFIYQKVDLLITSPYDEVATTEVVAKAYHSGIPVIMLDRTIAGDTYTTYIHPDNRKIAQESAKFLVRNIEYRGTVLLLKGVPRADSTRKRSEGFYEVVRQYPDIRVVECTANYLRRDALICVDTLLQQGEHFDAIMSQSDSMLIGARMALKAHHIDPASLITVGIDYIKSAQRAIRSGRQTSSFVYSLGAKESAQTAIDILSGKQVPKEILLPTQQVTRDNVDAVVPIF